MNQTGDTDKKRSSSLFLKTLSTSRLSQLTSFPLETKVNNKQPIVFAKHNEANICIIYETASVFAI